MSSGWTWVRPISVFFLICQGSFAGHHLPLAARLTRADVDRAGDCLPVLGMTAWRHDDGEGWRVEEDRRSPAETWPEQDLEKNWRRNTCWTHVEMIRKLGVHFFGHGPRTIFGVVALVPANPRRTQINLWRLWNHRRPFFEALVAFRSKKGAKKTGGDRCR